MSVEFIGIDRALTNLRRIADRVRRESSRAINDTALDVQKDTLTRLLPAKFQKRNVTWMRPGTRFGFNIRFSKPETMTATVGSQANWLKLQEEGGTKKASGHRVAVPTETVKPRGKIMAAKLKPRVLLGMNALGRYARAAGSSAARADARLAALQRNEVSEFNRRREAARNAGLSKGEARRQAQQAAAPYRALRKAGERDYRKSARALRRATNAVEQMKKATSGLLSGINPFLYEGDKMPRGIYVRRGKSRLPLKLLFAFHDHTRVKPLLGFVDEETRVVESRFNYHFGKRLAILSTL